MELTKVSENEQVQELKISIEKADYCEIVESNLRKKRREFQMPGFRVGHAPMSLIQKTYESQFILDTAFELVDNKLKEYLKENNIQVFLEPIPISEKTNYIPNAEGQMVFSFDLAIYPQFEIDFETLPPLKKYTVIPTEAEMDDAIENIRQQNSTSTDLTEITDESRFILQFDEKPHYCSFALFNEKSKDLLLGKKNGEKVEISFRDCFDSDAALSLFLRIPEDQLEKDNPYQYEVEVLSPKSIELPEVDEKLFKLVFPDDEIKTLDEFKAKLTSRVTNAQQREFDQMAFNNALSILVENTKITISKDFISKYILYTDKEKDEKWIENNIDKYCESIRVELIFAYLSKKYEIKIEFQDIRNYYTSYYYQYIFQNQIDFSSVAELDKTIDKDLKNNKIVEHIYDILLSDRIGKILFENMKLDVEEGYYLDLLSKIKPEEDTEAVETPIETAEIIEEQTPIAETSEEESAKIAQPKKTTTKEKKRTPTKNKENE